MKDLAKNFEDYFGKNCVGMDSFQAMNTPHHHILLFLAGGIMEDIDQNDSRISAEMPTEWDLEIPERVHRFNMNRQ